MSTLPLVCRGAGFDKAEVPFCANDILAASRAASLCLLYSRSIAASNDMIVSSGRSVRRLVGLEKSGSAVGAVSIQLQCISFRKTCQNILIGEPCMSKYWLDRSEAIVAFSSCCATTSIVSVAQSDAGL